MLDVDEFGLDDMDARVLKAIIEKFDGGPVGGSFQWAADDIIQNRPALSRWHKDHKDKFAAYVKDVTP